MNATRKLWANIDGTLEVYQTKADARGEREDLPAFRVAVVDLSDREGLLAVVMESVEYEIENNGTGGLSDYQKRELIVLTALAALGIPTPKR